VDQKGYQCYDPVSHHFYISRRVVFCEQKLFYEVEKFCMPYFLLFTTLLETPHSSPTIGDIFLESSSLEPH
jgi:hypothetical protein